MSSIVLAAAAFGDDPGRWPLPAARRVPDQWCRAVAAGGGDLGWTSGRYVATHTGPDGPVRSEGRYVTVWRRQPDGTWKVDLDTGVPDGR